MTQTEIRVQGFSALVAFAADWRLSHASDNCDKILGHDLTASIGMPMDKLLPSETAHHLRSRAQVINHDTTAARVFAIDPYKDGRLFDVTVHAEQDGYFFEFEPAQTHSPIRDETALVLRLVRRMRRARTQQAVLVEAARGFRMLSGLRHVLLLRDRQDGSATVLAADRSRPLAGVPAGDGERCDLSRIAGRISAQSALHIVADVEDEGTRVSPCSGDLQFAEAVSRFPGDLHQSWLIGHGLRSSLTVSVPSETAEVTVFVAHDQAPQQLDQHRRSAIELFVEFVSDELTRISLQEQIADLTMPMPIPAPKPTVPLRVMEDQRPFLKLVKNTGLDNVLVVDDDRLIALETVDMLSRVGATDIDSAATLEEAQSCLNNDTYSFAVLDVNLERGTTESLAQELSRRAVPFALATGMDPDDERLRGFPAAPLLQKPLSISQLKDVLTRLGLAEN